jgi:putative ABC transport system substrate-binding protein
MHLAALALALSMLAMPLAAETQEYKTEKLPQLGWLSLGSRSAHVESFRQGLREHGWVEGQTIRPIGFRWAEGNADRLRDLAAELVLLKSDVIIAPGAAAAVAARITKTIPIIMFSAGDPVANRIVASLARPGGNVTGLATISSALSGKRLQLLREAIPKAKRIAVLVNPANPSHPVALHGAEDAARRLGGFKLKWSSIEDGTIWWLHSRQRNGITPMACLRSMILSRSATEQRLRSWRPSIACPPCTGLEKRRKQGD